MSEHVGDALGAAAFEVYQVKLEPNAHTAPHNHLDDGDDDVFAVTAGDGWLVVDDERTAISLGQVLNVDSHHTRHLHAGPHGLTFTAVCSSRHSLISTAVGASGSVAATGTPDPTGFDLPEEPSKVPLPLGESPVVSGAGTGDHFVP